MLSRQTTPATANEPYFVSRVARPSIGFLFFVNCDHEGRSRQAYGDSSNVDSAASRLEAKRKLEQSGMQSKSSRPTGLSNVKTRYSTAAYAAISALFLISVPALADVSDHVKSACKGDYQRYCKAHQGQAPEGTARLHVALHQARVERLHFRPREERRHEPDPKTDRVKAQKAQAKRPATKRTTTKKRTTRTTSRKKR